MIGTGQNNRPLFTVMFISFVISTIDFMLTANPYQALHSGRAGYSSAYTSSSWLFDIKFAILAALLIAVLMILLKNSWRFQYPNSLLIFLALMVISNFINGSVFTQPQTLIYNLITICLVGVIAYNGDKAAEDNIKTEADETRIWKLLFIIYIAAIILAVLWPYRYGLVRFSFSRAVRGEITYFSVLGCTWLFMGISFVLYERERKFKFLIPAVINLILQVSFYNRSLVVSALIPYIIYFGFRTKGNKKVIIWLFAFALSPIIINALYDFLFLGGATKDYWTSNAAELVTSGRNELWGFFLKGFLQHPLFGVGLNYQTSADYMGRASSEISLLKWFAEQGIFTGLMLSYFLIKAFVSALKIIRTDNCSVWDLTVSYIFLSVFIDTLLQSNSRILNFSNFSVWYSMFYLCRRKKELSAANLNYVRGENENQVFG